MYPNAVADGNVGLFELNTDKVSLVFNGVTAAARGHRDGCAINDQPFRPACQQNGVRRAVSGSLPFTGQVKRCVALDQIRRGAIGGRNGRAIVHHGICALNIDRHAIHLNIAVVVQRTAGNQHSGTVRLIKINSAFMVQRTTITSDIAESAVSGVGRFKGGIAG